MAEPAPEESILSQFMPLIKLNPKYLHQIGSKVPIPFFPETTLVRLCNHAISVFQKQENVLKLSSPMVIIGDVFGSLVDILKIFASLKRDQGYKILFLGNYVDYGPLSLEVITLLLTLVTNFPDRVFLLRGNHEFPSICTQRGFQDELLNEYHSDLLLSSFSSVFSWMPLAAVVDSKYFCVHSGISRNMRVINDINSVQRPLYGFSDAIVHDLMWREAVDKDVGFTDSKSSSTTNFGTRALQSFLTNNKIKKIITGNKAKGQGVEISCGGNAISVFSCSNIDGKMDKIGYLIINSRRKVVAKTISSTQLAERDKCNFCDTEEQARTWESLDDIFGE